MTAPRRGLSPEVSAGLLQSIVHHVERIAAATDQAAEVLKTEDKAEKAIVRYGLALLGQSFDCEIATHEAALTAIRVALAMLDAQGFEVRGLVAVVNDPSLLEDLHQAETETDPTPG